MQDTKETQLNFTGKYRTGVLLYQISPKEKAILQ